MESPKKQATSQKKFRRQHVIDSYIVDFVCLETKLVIEIDGRQHLEQKIYDQNLTDYLEKLGYRVIRFWNNEVLKELDAVTNAIYMAIADSPSPQPSPLTGGCSSVQMLSFTAKVWPTLP
jgi:very-short-patch-repair endonuclease